MEKKNIISIICLAIFFFKGYTQEKTNIIRPGLIRAMGTISPSKMLGNGGAYFYLHGNLEVYFNKKVSFCGDVYSFTGSINKTSDYEYNHNLFYGLLWHFTKNRNDLYLALQPGVSFTKLNAGVVNIPVSRAGVNPEFSLAVGDNFYISRFFNFFIQTRLIIGEHSYDVHKNLSELRLSAGLGFNINVLKEK